MNSTILLLFLFVQNSFSMPKTSSMDCNFYPNLEKSLKCNKETDYLLNYGLSYCSKFLELKNSCSKDLRTWIEKTTVCLQDQLAKNPRFLKNCKVMEDFAFGTHPTCYMDSGFCRLTSDDRKAVYKTVISWNIVNSLYIATHTFIQALRTKMVCDFGFLGEAKVFMQLIMEFVRESPLKSKSRKLAAKIVEEIPFNDEQALKYVSVGYSVLISEDLKQNPKIASAVEDALKLNPDLFALFRDCRRDPKTSASSKICRMVDLDSVLVVDPRINAQSAATEAQLEKARVFQLELMIKAMGSLKQQNKK